MSKDVTESKHVTELEVLFPSPPSKHIDIGAILEKGRSRQDIICDSMALYGIFRAYLREYKRFAIIDAETKKVWLEIDDPDIQHENTTNFVAIKIRFSNEVFRGLQKQADKDGCSVEHIIRKGIRLYRTIYMHTTTPGRRLGTVYVTELKIPFMANLTQYR